MKNWKEPNRPVLNFGCKEFRYFLPQDVDEAKIGQVWHLIPRLKRDSNQLSNKRYNPPEPDKNQIILFRLLQMFHKKPFLISRFAPQGTSLLVRAKNKKYLDIFFRYLFLKLILKKFIKYLKKKQNSCRISIE